MSAQVAADLRAAAEVLKRDGWTQGIYYSPRGGYCVEGALLIAQGSDFPHGGDQVKPSWPRLNMACRALCSDLVATNWNDAPGRTADEVIAALEAAADTAEATP